MKLHSVLTYHSLTGRHRQRWKQSQEEQHALDLVRTANELLQPIHFQIQLVLRFFIDGVAFYLCVVALVIHVHINQCQGPVIE